MLSALFALCELGAANGMIEMENCIYYIESAYVQDVKFLTESANKRRKVVIKPKSKGFSDLPGM